MTEPKRVVIRHTETVINVGKTKARITIDGCVRCGKEIAESWHPDRCVTFSDGKRSHLIELSRCNSCDRDTGPGLF